MNPVARRGFMRGLLIAGLLATVWLGWAIAYLLESHHSFKHRDPQPSRCECIHNT